jgi:hypothetical protein
LQMMNIGPERSDGCVDDAFGLQGFDPFLRITQNLPQDLRGMFAEERCGSPHLPRRLRQADRGAGDPDRSDAGLIHGDEHVPVADNRILADLLDVVDLGVGDVLLFEDLDPLPGRVFVQLRGP